MSQENVEIVRRSLNAFDRRDRDAWLALREPDSEVVPIPEGPEPRTIRGREAGWDNYIEVIEAFEQVALSDAELVDAGPDMVLVHGRNEMRGRASGANLELDYWVVVTFRERKILRDQWFLAHDQALQAAGLSE